jgi:hypothetical protein
MLPEQFPTPETTDDAGDLGPPLYLRAGQVTGQPSGQNNGKPGRGEGGGERGRRSHKFPVGT